MENPKSPNPGAVHVAGATLKVCTLFPCSPHAGWQEMKSISNWLCPWFLDRLSKPICLLPQTPPPKKKKGRKKPLFYWKCLISAFRRLYILTSSVHLRPGICRIYAHTRPPLHMNALHTLFSWIMESVSSSSVQHPSHYYYWKFGLTKNSYNLWPDTDLLAHLEW